MYISPTRSALIMSLEATSSAFLAYIFLHEVLSISELIGCCFMFSATVLSTTSSAEEEPTQTILEKAHLSSESMSHFSDSSETANSFNFAETSDLLERFLVTKQRSLRRNIVLRRSRSHSDRKDERWNHDHESTQLLPLPPCSSDDDGGSHSVDSNSVFPSKARHYGSL